jgi:hypothetical protein
MRVSLPPSFITHMPASFVAWFGVLLSRTLLGFSSCLGSKTSESLGIISQEGDCSMPEPTEIWLSDPDGLLRKHATQLMLDFENELAPPLDLSKVLFFRIIGNRDLKKKGCTWRLLPPYSKLVKGASQLLQYSSSEAVMDEVPEILETIDAKVVIGIYDDHHVSESDRLHTLLHELHHIDNTNGQMDRLRDHDLKDFSWLVTRFGIGGSDLAVFDKILDKMST